MRETTYFFLVLLMFAFLLSGCLKEPAYEVPEAWQEPDWSTVNDWLYQLQRAHPDRIGETKFDLVVASMSIAGGNPKVIEALKHSPGGEKIVLCYISIGQAERYRYYWQSEWDTNPPSWLDEPDPDWTDDYWVKYWEPDWQEIIYGSPESYLDQIIELGFDGIYLDRVDTYQYYEARGRETAAQEMVDFIMTFTDYARQRRPGFGVFPQNAEELGLMFPDYLAAMTGIGIEDLYYGYPRDHEASPADWTANREDILRQWVEARNLVLIVDYTSRPEQIEDAYLRARANGFVPYVADRSLGRLRINDGFEPD
jgi:cysteinyl-tRNA synthetase